jgi:protein associated with RNAse G/E
MPLYTVIKLDHNGRKVHHYQGQLLERRDHRIILEAFFDREDTAVGEVVLRKGDRFVEAYYDDRWYNIFEVRDQNNGQLKCWYCNITCPAEFREREIAYRDLALDLLVYPDGRQSVLDEEEFLAMTISTQVRTQARQAVSELKKYFQIGIALP